jgi:hypothetical protein
VFTDVALESWYAPFVFSAARLGIMSGYTDSTGQPSGRFGPDDPVNLAQLSKIAHEMTGLDQTKTRGVLQNLLAPGTWFETYYRSAEQQYWHVFLNPFDDPGRPVTRAEVVAVLLQAFDVPRLWPKGDLFADVTPLTRYADTIETAARDGIVSGTINEENQNVFRPDDPVNRAELSKMVSLALEAYGESTAEIRADDPRDAPSTSR